MIYNPPQTELLRTAAALGVPYANGLSMLVHQGARALEIWSNAPVPVSAMRAAARMGLKFVVLDRPNPAGRPVEGLILRPGWESFVGAGPIPMRHGLTLGELGLWFVDYFRLDVDYRVIEMEGYAPDTAPGFGWPEDRIWINPSPNAPNLNMARAYAGTVMLEGTTLSEGRGTTRPLELLGAPGLEPRSLLTAMSRIVPSWPSRRIRSPRSSASSTSAWPSTT
mgnify:CR=1 FL=1